MPDLLFVFGCVVRNCCKVVGLEHIAPHDLRRTCAKLCHSGGDELEQIQS
jgi:integrase